MVAKRSVFHCLIREHSGRTNDMDTIEYATFCYDRVEVANELKSIPWVFSPPLNSNGDWMDNSI